MNWQWHYLRQASFTRHSTAKVYCPIAETEFKAFARIGKELITPTTGARGRQRLMWLYLLNETDLFQKKNALLHIAPELSLMGRLQEQSDITYIPGDKMEKGYVNQHGVRNIDLTALDFPDESFDYIICSHVLEHIPDDKKAMQEMFRVLKPGGRAIILVPMRGAATTYEDWSITSPKERHKHFGQWDHVRWYGDDIKERLEEAGFIVKMEEYSSRFSEEEVKKYGLSKNTIISADSPL